MPRRKKAAASPAEPEEAPPSKRSRGDGDAVSPDDRVLRWQWEDDGGKWKTYSQQFQDLLSDGFRGDAKPVTLSVSAKVTMKVDFDKMIQKNRVTGWERRVRLAVSDKGLDDFRVWEYEDDRSHWCPYSAAHTLSLEGATEAGDETIALTGPRHSYTVDLTSKTQTNDSTGASRSVRSDDVDIDTPSDDVIPQPEVTPAAKSTGAAPSTSGRGASKSAASAKGSSGRATSNGAAKSGRKSAGGDTVRTLVMKGAAPVDPECTAKVNTAHVYSRGKDVYDAMLNQTNLSNNNNKYYLMQVLEDDARKAYSVWFRWGRVGYNGQTTLIPCGPDVDDAIHTFTKKFQDKTKNAWSERSKFQKVAGKYDLVKMDYSTESVKKEDNPKKPENVPDSKLEKRLQSLINLICDVKRMEDAVIEMKYDAKKAPLGKLTANQIKAGYAALKKIDTYIEKSDLGSKLVQACDEFYTRIPHDFGMRTPPVIRTKADVKLKLNLLEALSDIEIAMNIIKESNIDENPVDTHYNSLKCGMTAMDKTCGDYKMIEDYLKNTHAKTHNQYSMSILDVFNVDKDSETKGFKDKGNRMLLWHGSRLTNWVGILSQGLRIAPPEAPVTGYMFGKGVYFADMSSKSANYCYPSQAKTEGLLLLCEVSLGSCNELLSADYKADQLPAGKHSVYGKGSTAPDAKKNFTMSNGCVVPIGKSVDTGVKNPNGYTLNYNEFIVYNLNQIKMKYLIRVKFNFK